MRDVYWSGVLARRIGRRRAIAATGATALGAAFLAACGGGKNNGSKTDASGMITANEDTSAKAVPGGIMQEYQPLDPTTLDPILSPGSATTEFLKNVYDRPLWRQLGLNRVPGPIAGNAAESYELSPDGLTLTMKLRQNHLWDQRAPTSGRPMTTQDIAFSWDRFVARSAFAGDLAQQKSKSAPVLNMTTPDDKTFVFHLGFPFRSILDLLAGANYFHIMPVEADGKFDPRSTARGSGPFSIDKWEPSSNIQYKKNPNWWLKGHPYLDGITNTFVKDYAAQLAQFESGTFWAFDDIQQEDVLRVKHDHADMVLRVSTAPGGYGSQGHYLILSQQPDSPMKDVRVRRASSMLLDRDLWIETYYNTKEFQDAGLPISINWNTCMSADYPETLRPNNADLAKKLGEGAQYYQYNVAEAKKLLAAAGYKNQPLSYYVDNRSPERQRPNELMDGFLRDSLNLQYEVLDYATSWRQTEQAGGTQHSGFCYASASGFNAENYLSSVMLPEGKFSAFTSVIYPELDTMVRKMRSEIDEQKQIGLMNDIQSWASLNWPTLIFPGSSLGFILHWPWLENHGVFVPGENGAVSTAPDESIARWYNKSKDPRKS